MPPPVTCAVISGSRIASQARNILSSIFQVSGASSPPDSCQNDCQVLVHGEIWKVDLGTRDRVKIPMSTSNFAVERHLTALQ